MRTIKAKIIKDAVRDLVLKASFDLRPDVYNALKDAFKKETKTRSKKALGILLENAEIARKKMIPICQDTGLPEVFAEVGNKVNIEGDLDSAINSGVKEGYKKGCLRESVVRCPIARTGPSQSTPAVIHHRIMAGDKVKLTFIAKGFGCENVSKIKMLKPTQGPKEIKDFVVECIKEAGPDACPPYFIGLGIGGSQNKAALLAKEALCHPVSMRKNKSRITKLENEIYKDANKTRIGAMGFGGKFTVLGIKILTHPTHIAGLPVAVNISCHALRTASKIL